jgi:hypothetical protein
MLLKIGVTAIMTHCRRCGAAYYPQENYLGTIGYYGELCRDTATIKLKCAGRILS